VLPAEVHARLRADFPVLDLGSATYLGEGYAYAAYRLRSRDTAGALGDWTLRIPKHPGAAWGHARTGDLERELRLFELLDGYDFGVAVPRNPQLVRDAGGQTIAGLHRFIPGAALAGAALPRGAVRQTLAGDIGRFLSRLHAVPVAVARKAGVREADLGTAIYPALVEQAAPHLGAATLAWLRAETAAFLAAGGSATAPRVPIHADISGRHLLVSAEGRLTGVIDFADILIADPALDFAGVLNDLTWRDLERVWAHYEGPLDADLERRVRYYIAVAPLFQVVYGADGVGPQERAQGVRRLAARAAAARAAAARRG